MLDEAERRDNARVVDQLREESLESLRPGQGDVGAYGSTTIGATFRVRNDLISWEEGLRIVDNATSASAQLGLLEANSRTQRQREMIAASGRRAARADAARGQAARILVREDGAALGVFADTELCSGHGTRWPSALRRSATCSCRRRPARARRPPSALGRPPSPAGADRAGLLLMASWPRPMVRNIYRAWRACADLSAQMRKRDIRRAPASIPAASGPGHGRLPAMRDDVRRFEHELNGQLLRNERVRASLQQSEEFQRRCWLRRRWR